MGVGISRPAVSVVMPLYNKEREVSRAIRSVLAQTFIDYELIVVNDGSTDRSVDAVVSFNDPRIRRVHQENQGVSAARNRGVAEAQAELVAFLDADDEWLPEFLATIIRLHATYGQCGVYATSYYVLRGGQPERQAVLRRVPADYFEGVLEDYFQVATHSEPPVCSSAVAVRKGLLSAIGGFPVGVIAGEDLLTWARLAVRTDVAYCRIPLARFYAPDVITDRPPRIPQSPDVVGHGLSALLDNAPPEHREGLKEYLGLWHRMRGVVFLELERGADAREEIGQGNRYSGPSPRLAILYLLSFLPGTLVSKSCRLVSELLCVLRSTQEK